MRNPHSRRAQKGIFGAMKRNSLELLATEILAADSPHIQGLRSILKSTVAMPFRALKGVNRHPAYHQRQPRQQACKFSNSMFKLPALAILLVASLSSASAQSNPSAPTGATALPDGAGKSIAQRACSSCHSLQMITSKRASVDGWTQVVNDMVNRGANLSDDEIDTLIQYLSTNLSPATPKNEAPTTPGTTGQLSSPDKAEQTPASGTSAPSASLHLNMNKTATQ